MRPTQSLEADRGTTTMTIQFSLSLTKMLALPALAAVLLAGCGATRPAALAPPVPRSQSVAEAERKLALVARERAQAEAAFAASEQLCYAKFFVNNCLDGARERRRATLSGLRAIEIEAEHFKRQSNVDARDRALAKAEQEFQAQQARMAAEAPQAKPAPAPSQRETR
jgi:colicin import membrane protein